MPYENSNATEDTLESRFVRKIPKSFYYSMKLPSHVKEESVWRDLIHFLREMTEEDTLEIECSGYGGDVQIGSNFLNGLSRCKADLKVRITGDCWSMHALIATFHPNTEIDDLAHLMFHNMSHQSWGKLNETIDQVDFYKEWMPTYLKKVAGQILTKKDISDICNGRDIYLTPDQFRQRRKAGLPDAKPSKRSAKK